MKITVFDLYPDLLNLYSDSGNIIALEKRCRWRGIEFERKCILREEIPSFDEADIVFIGGGADKEVISVAGKLEKYADKLREFAASDGVVLGICGGYQLLGNYFENDGEKVKGAGLLDCYTVSADSRMVSDVIIETDFGTVIGFENHKGKTYINSEKPLGKLLFGSGNNGEDGYEGAVNKNVFGTYLHGPLLPKNPALCDELIRRALIRKYGEEITLEALSDDEENASKDYIVNRFLKG